jgi:hypothetical protein
MEIASQRIGIAIVVAALLLWPSVTLGTDSPRSLFSQTAQSALDREFPSPWISYVLLDARSGSILAERWPHAGNPIPVGSLIKPFTALAYARRHRTFPTVICDGQRHACWRPRGHGQIALKAAIAQSCNAYFLALARDISADDADAVFRTYGLPPVSASNKTRSLAGLSNDWQVSPLVLARAYADLAQRLQQSEPEIYSGMQSSAHVGTAGAVSTAVPGDVVLAKTGTARCTHTPAASADGFTVVLYPADSPRLVLLTRIHGVTGATAAVTAGHILRTLEVSEP